MNNECKYSEPTNIEVYWCKKNNQPCNNCKNNFNKGERK
jgi:hypothetical protein